MRRGGTSSLSRNNLHLSQRIEKATEHLLRIDAIGEPGLSRLDRAGDVVEFAVQNEITEPPRRDLLIRNVTQTVLGNDAAPERLLVCHVGCERGWHRVGYFHVEHERNARPHM